jgi:alpha-ketoglutarate-dependent taurine dioxygenase
VKIKPAFENLGATLDGSDEPDLFELKTDKVVELLKSTGFVLFTGFETDTNKFEQFSNLFSTDYMDHRGGGAMREVINKDGDKTILSVAYAFNKNKGDFDKSSQRTFPLALHSDRDYTRSHPPIIWFYCVTPAAKEGETTICDGVQVCEQFQDSTRQFLKENRIKYVRRYRADEWQLLFQVKDLDEMQTYCDNNSLKLIVNPDGSVVTEYAKFAIVKPRWSDQDAFVNSILLVQWQEDEVTGDRSVVRMEDGSPIPAEIIAEIRAVTDHLTHNIQWNPGEMCMIDNTRMLHGRNGFLDPHREVYIRMCRSVTW